MFFQNENLYNPFTNTYLGFSLSEENSQENNTLFIIDNLDLYYQPTELPSSAISLFVIRFPLFCLGIFIQIKLFRMVRKEKGLVNEVTQFYSITSMSISPIWLLFVTTTDFLHPLKDIIGRWFCIFGRFTIYFHFNMLLFHSFIVALMRYFFIVHEEKVKKFGKDKTKKVFLFLAISFPIIFLVWGAIENQDIATLIFLNRCYGIIDKVFMAELTTGKNLGCVFSNGGYLDIILQITCITKGIVFILMCLNVSEAIIYYRIFSHITRYYIENC